jgi:hypothetical protein
MPPEDPPARPPVNPIDRDIADAFAALDRTAQDRPRDDFSSRVMARISGDAPVDVGGGAGAGAGAEKPPRPARPGPDDSGLHDIKALASQAKRRLSERDQSESDAGESVMLAAAPGGLRAVMLPEAGRSAPAPAQEMRVPREPTRTDSRSSVAYWLLGSVATVAAAAAVAVFVFGIGRHKERQPGAELARVETPPMGAGAAAGAGGLATAPAAPGPGATAAPSGVLADRIERDEHAGAAAGDEGAPAGEQARPASRAEARQEGARERGAEASKHRRDEAKRSSGAPAPEATRPPDGEAEGSAGPGPGAHGGADPSAGGSPGAKEPGDKPAGDSAGKSGGGDVNLEDMIDSVADEDKPAARKPDAPPRQVDKQKEEPAKAEKKELDRREVSRALEDIHGQVQSCRDAEQFTGTVTVRFAVAPSGQVTAATATGAHSRSRTGACVAKAVRQARFPAFEGVPITFTYPFLLSR